MSVVTAIVPRIKNSVSQTIARHDSLVFVSHCDIHVDDLRSSIVEKGKEEVEKKKKMDNRITLSFCHQHHFFSISRSIPT